MLAVGPDYGFGLYVHWPYCARICPYCDFNVYAAKDRDTEPLVNAIIADIQAHRERLPDHPKLNSVFLGGGTPSLLRAADMARIMSAANDAFGFAPSAEITLEANPNDVLRSDPNSWVQAGINRLSLGVQSLNDTALRFLGRDHDSLQAKTAIEQVQSVFDNHSIDLIYARPGQSSQSWGDELEAALALGAPHLSLYELTIEERTAFGKRAARGELLPLPDDDQADLYELTQSICEAYGLPAYEVSNHTSDEKYESRHNHIYWASGDWIGVGPGAHGRLTMDGQRYATEAARRPEDYIRSGPMPFAALSRQDTAREFLAMALRPTAGLDLERFNHLFQRGADQETVSTLVENSHAVLDGTLLKLTVQGRLVADYIASLLAPY
ncbi:MAG: radical SAM family heme chaperone HemW [Hyphomonadaceae bacterium]|nr:radical SAM family heme chaperone HemW [Hyphomonadaceae bacterium]